jgi:hypothetical protein
MKKFICSMVIALAASTTHASDTLEQKPADLNCRCVSSDVTMLRFRFLLKAISEKQPGLSREEIGDMTVKAQQVAKESLGLDLKLLDLMEAGRRVIMVAPGKPDYARALAAILAQKAGG